jgi:hypothetical protein
VLTEMMGGNGDVMRSKSAVVSDWMMREMPEDSDERKRMAEGMAGSVTGSVRRKR